MTARAEKTFFRLALLRNGRWRWISTQVRNEKKISSSKQISRSGREGQLNHGKKWPLWGRHRLKTLRLVLLMRSLNERAVGLKEGKTKWRRKAYSSRERFLSNREPRSSQSLWFIIILGISHSCPTFCIRILKTEFVLPKLASGSSSSSRSSDLCRFPIVQFVQKFTANQDIEHLSIAEHETGRNLIDLRQTWNL